MDGNGWFELAVTVAGYNINAYYVFTQINSPFVVFFLGRKKNNAWAQRFVGDIFPSLNPPLGG